MAHSLSEHIFMSYSRKDERIMRRITGFLRNDGLNIWVDNEELIPGTEIWRAEIEKAITNSKAVIVLLSPSSKRSKWVAREIEYADLYQKRIFPVVIRGDPKSIIPINLITIQFVDMRSNEQESLDDLRTALSSYIDELRSQEQKSRKLREIQDKKARQESRKLENAQAKREVTQLKNEEEPQKVVNRETSQKSIVINRISKKGRGSEKGTRLIYQYAISHLSKKTCDIFIGTLQTRVATKYMLSENGKKPSIVNDFYEFITTSRATERWLQEVEAGIYKMGKEKTPSELWMVIGGYGAGKSHSKNFLTRNNISNVRFLELEVASLLSNSKQISSEIGDIFSLVLWTTRSYLDVLYDSIATQIPSTSTGNVNKKIKEVLTSYFIDDEFASVFCDYGGSPEKRKPSFEPLEKLIINKGERIFLPLMRLYKRYLRINALCIFIDEFEELQLFSSERRWKFVESIRAMYDTMASTFRDSDVPSFKMMILCTLSFWNEIADDSYFRALTTRLRLFELRPLIEDEIIALAEKLYTLYKKSGNLHYEIELDFTKIIPYLIRIAGIEEPLTPRFIIKQLMDVIESPDEFIRSSSSML